MNSTAIPLRPVARLAPVLPEALLLLTIVTGLVLRWIWWDEFTYSVFTDRDLLRSLFLWDDEFPYTASEIGRRTARSPGALLYYFTWLIQQLNPDTFFIYAVIVAMDCLAVVLIPFIFRGAIGSRAALFATALYAVTPSVLENVWKFWNPSFCLLFAVLAHGFLLAYRSPADKWRLAAAFGCISIALQFHISLIYLVPIFALYLPIARYRVSLGAVAAAILGFAVPLLPYLVLDGIDGFSNTVAVFASHDTSVGPQEMGPQVSLFDRVAISTTRVTGGRIFAADELPARVNAVPGLAMMAMVLFNAGLVAIIAWLPLAVSRAARRQPIFETLRRGAHVNVAGLVFLAAATMIIAMMITSNNAGRYFLFLLMPPILLAGVAFQEITHALERRPGTTVLGLLVALTFTGLLLSRGVALAAYYGSARHETHSSFAVKKQIVRTLKQEFGFDIADIDFRVGLVLVGQHGAEFYATSENLALGYISRTLETPSGRRRDDDCVLVIAPERHQGRPVPDALKLASILPRIGDLPPGRVLEVENLVFVGYRAPDRNCLRSFSNAYFLTEMEKLLERDGATGAPNTLKEIEASKEGQRFTATLGEQAMVSVLFELSTTADTARLTLHGNSFRGYAPSFSILRAQLSGSRVEFSREGRVVQAIVGPESLGANGLYTPWQFGPVSLPAGRYDVEFVFSGLQSPKGRDPGSRIRVGSLTIGASTESTSR